MAELKRRSDEMEPEIKLGEYLERTLKKEYEEAH